MTNHAVVPAQAVEDSSTDLDASGLGGIAVDSLRRMFGWQVREVQGENYLVLGGGVAAVEVPIERAQVAVTLLRDGSLFGPVIELLTAPARWVFLADPNGLVPNPAKVPRGVRVLDCPEQILLPSHHTSRTCARWAVLPQAHRRWLPTLDTVLGAFRSTLSVPVAGRSDAA